MYFFDAVGVALRLKHNEVSSKERFLYLLIGAFFFTISGTNFFLHNISKAYSADLNVVDYISDAISIASLYGIFFCHKINAKGDDKNFIERFVCLSLPITIRAILFCTLLLFLGGLVFGIFSFDFDIEPYIYILALVLYIGYFYIKMIACIKISSGYTS